MQQAEFEAELKSASYVEIESRATDPGPVDSGYTVCDIRGLVLSGIFIVNQGDGPVTYRAADVLSVSAGSSHTEEIGASGAHRDGKEVLGAQAQLRRWLARTSASAISMSATVG